MSFKRIGRSILMSETDYVITKDGIFSRADVSLI